MAIDFPNSPSTNQTYTVGATTWTYDGEKWVVTTSGRTGPSAVVVSDTAPSVPSSGTLWYNSTNGKTYAYYTDSTSSQWVEVGNADPTFSALTTKGDILTRSSSAMTRLGVGSNHRVLTADSAATEGVKWAESPQVAANTAGRPSSPYEGQMIYQADTNQILAYDGSAWVMIADTDQPPGLQLVKSGSLSLTTSATNVTDAFSSDFKQYRLLLNVTGRSASNRVDMRYIVGTTPISSSYYQGGIASDWGSNTTVYMQRSNSDAQFYGITSGTISSLIMDIFNANQPVSTLHTGSCIDNGSGYGFALGGLNQTNNQCTGFQLFTSTGTATVEYQVFGYRN